MPDESPSPAKKPRWRAWAIEAAVVVAIVIGVRAFQRSNVASGEVPSAALVDAAGREVTLRGGERPVLVHFVASWCGVCDMEQPNVLSVARDHDVVAVVAQSGTAAQVRGWAAREGWNDARIVVDEEGDLAERWGVSAYPTSFFVDPSGAIRSVEVGYTSELGLRARFWLAGL